MSGNLSENSLLEYWEKNKSQITSSIPEDIRGPCEEIIFNFFKATALNVRSRELSEKPLPATVRINSPVRRSFFQNTEDRQKQMHSDLQSLGYDCKVNGNDILPKIYRVISGFCKQELKTDEIIPDYRRI